MSILFSPKEIGPVEVKNRFVAASTYECMASETGEITDMLINRYRSLAKGGVGLVIPGYMYINSVGKATKFQVGIHDDAMIAGLKRLTQIVHDNGSKIFFQLDHAGRQTTKEVIGQTPLGPSAGKSDPVFRVKPRAMTGEEIKQTINDFANAAKRARESGADGIQIKAANGYLLNEFLSPFFNQRTDEWGGSDENRYQILREVIHACRKAINKDMALIVKLCTNDYTPKPGMTPELAKKYAGWLVQDGIDGLETSQGTFSFSMMNISRGDVPVRDLVKFVPIWMRPIAWLMIRSWVGKYNAEEGWNLADARIVKTAIEDKPLLLVGGLRKLKTMQKIVEEKEADFISLSRPLIREPNLVEKFRTNQSEVATCVSCNQCVVAIINNLPLHCYYQKTARA